MRNLTHYSLHPFSFYKQIVNRRHDPAKSSLLAMEGQMETEFNEFIRHDINGTLHLLPSMTMTDAQKQLHLDNYSYSKTKNLREAVMQRQHEIQDKICPFCTINEYTTMDHFLPKELYPSHSVNSNNLIPCCQGCQNFKGTKVSEGGNRLFLNLYSDILPDEQYLFVRFIFNGNTLPVIEFFMQNVNGIDPVLFRIILSHYDKLHLFERFSDLAFDEIKKLQSQIRYFVGILPDEEIKRSVYSQCSDDCAYYGSNYWKSILMKACIDDSQIFSLIKQNIF